MNNIETNALRIAELMGSRTYINDGIRRHDYNNAIYLECDIIDKFSSYNGLMPIVFECNGGEHYGITINWSVGLTDKTNGKTLYYDFRVGLETETEFIESIQQACIKYLELKND